jgi:hypothetical protein
MKTCPKREQNECDGNDKKTSSTAEAKREPTKRQHSEEEDDRCANPNGPRKGGKTKQALRERRAYDC